MDKQEAKLLLQSYRPDGRDSADPAFAEALEFAQKDRELSAWFEQERSLDVVISRRLQKSSVPEDLRPSILAGQRSQRRMVRRPVTWWKSPALAWAAGIVLLFVAAYFFRSGSGSHVALAMYRNAMTANLQSSFTFDLQDTQPDHIKQWLDHNLALTGLQFPPELDKTIGCKVFNFGDMKPALICFSLPDQKMVHLFVVDGSRFEAKDFDSSRCTSKCNDYNTLAWRDSKRVFLLAGNVDPVRLNEIAGKLKQLSATAPIQ
ncbi:hypothetical protein GC207_06485 [bacterium]|nr:hypothetical protein [bacterium]